MNLPTALLFIAGVTATVLVIFLTWRAGVRSRAQAAERSRRAPAGPSPFVRAAMEGMQAGASVASGARTETSADWKTDRPRPKPAWGAGGGGARRIVQPMSASGTNGQAFGFSHGGPGAGGNDGGSSLINGMLLGQMMSAGGEGHPVTSVGDQTTPGSGAEAPAHSHHADPAPCSDAPSHNSCSSAPSTNACSAPSSCSSSSGSSCAGASAGCGGGT